MNKITALVLGLLQIGAMAYIFSPLAFPSRLFCQSDSMASSEKLNNFDALEMKNFLDVVSSPSQEIKLQWPVSDSSWQETVHTINVSALTKISVSREMDDNCTIEWDANKPVLEALVLPSDMSWPGLNGDLDSKQLNVILPNVLFHRSSNECLGREENTVRILLSDDCVAWIGLPGIGKTASTNVIMLEIIRKMVEGRTEENPNVPTVLFVRMSKNCFIIKRSAGQWQVESFKSDISNLSEVFDELSENYGKRNVLGLVELDENEEDPKAFFRLFVSTSSRNVQGSVLKTMMKAGCAVYLCDPWPKQQLEIAAAVLSHLSRDKQCVKDWETRFARVGGLPRIVFASDVDYERHDDGIKHLKFSDLKDSLKRLDVYNIPSSWKYLIAPFLRKGINNPIIGKRCKIRKDGSGFEIIDKAIRGSLDIFEYRFLSDNLKLEVLRMIELPDQLRALAEYGLEYQMHEAVVLLGCAKTVHPDRAEMDPKWLAENWQWYEQTKTNPFTAQLPQSEVLKILSGWNTSREVHFASQLLNQSVSTLDERSVYKSTLVNGYLLDMLTVNHSLKMLYIFQVTDLKPIDHSMSVSTLHNVFKGLRMLNEGVDSEYGVTYVMVIPAYDKLPDCGVCFDVDSLNKCVPYNDILKKNEDKSFKFPEHVRRDVSKIRKVYIARAMFAGSNVEIIPGAVQTKPTARRGRPKVRNLNQDVL